MASVQQQTRLRAESPDRPDRLRRSGAFADLLEVQESISDPARRAKRLQFAMEHIRRCCGAGESGERQTDSVEADLEAWLEQEGYDTDVIMEVLDMGWDIVKRIKEARKRGDITSQKIKLIFVGHGYITDHMIPARRHCSFPPLLDVVLYEPWNCSIDAQVAYGITSGSITPQMCKFECDKWSCPFSDLMHEEYHKDIGRRCNPSTCWVLSYRASHRHHHTVYPEWNRQRRSWNRMSETRGEVPEVYLSTMDVPEDGAWEQFLILESQRPHSGRDRVVVPFFWPKLKGKVVPLTLVSMLMSLALHFSGLTAELHLVACLSRDSDMDLNTPLQHFEYLKRQYYVSSDYTAMSTTEDIFIHNQQLYDFFKTVFGQRPGSGQRRSKDCTLV